MLRFALASVLLVLALAVAVAEEGKFETRTYDVSSFTGWVPPRATVPRLGPSASGGLGYFEDDEQEEAGYLPLPVERLADLIKEVVAPQTWVRGGRVWCEGRGTLVVTNRPEVHREVAALIAEIGAPASRRALVTLEAFDLPRERYTEVVSATEPAAIDFDALGATRLESASVEAWPGVRTALKVTNRVRYIRDYDVEIAQGANISDPIVDVAEEGLAAEVHAHPTLDGANILLEVILQSGRFERPMRKVELPVDEEYLPTPYRSEARSTIGTLELPIYRKSDACVTRLVPSGGSFLLPLLSEDRCVVLRFRASTLGAATEGRLLDVGALARSPAVGVYTLPDAEDTSMAAMVAPILRRVYGGSGPFVAGENLASLPDQLEVLRPGAGTVTLEGNGFLLVDGQPELRTWLRSMVRQREEELIRPVTLGLTLWSLPAAPEVGEGKPVDPEGAERLFSAGLSTVSGRWTGFMAGDTMNYLADFDVEVAQEARIADPIVGQSFSGVVANVRPVLIPDGSRARIALRLLLARRGKVDKFQTGAQFLGTVETFEEYWTALDTMAETALNTPYTIDAGPDPRASSRRLAVVLLPRAQ